jgi:DNA topoisomerase-1
MGRPKKVYKTVNQSEKQIETPKDSKQKNTEFIGKKNLFIVESPAKIKKIQYFLGQDFLVKASVGHIRDLQKSKTSNIPKEKYGIDVDNDFKAYYIIK